jgi:integrase
MAESPESPKSPRRPKLTKKRVDALRTDKPGGERTYCGALAGFGVHVLPSGRKSFFHEYVPPGGGRRRRMKLGSYGDLTVAEAIDERKRVVGLLREGVDPLEERRRQKEAGTFAEWTERYKSLGKAAGRWGERSFVEVARHLKRASEAFGHKRLADVSAQDVENLRDAAHDSYGLATANRTITSVKACLNEAWRRGLVPANEASKVSRIRGESPRSRTLSDDEMDLLIRAVLAHEDPRFRVAMLWLALTGARRSEVLRATWGDLRLDPPERAEWTIPKPKNKRPSVRPLPADLAREIGRLPRDSVLVVGEWTDRRFDKVWRKLRTAAGLPDDIHLHDLRRTAGLRAARVGGLQVAQRLLGHADISTTARVYTPLTTDDLREHQSAAVAKILPFSRKSGAETDGR